jgi:hypothetical protein
MTKGRKLRPCSVERNFRIPPPEIFDLGADGILVVHVPMPLLITIRTRLQELRIAPHITLIILSRCKYLLVNYIPQFRRHIEEPKCNVPIQLLESRDISLPFPRIPQEPERNGHILMEILSFSIFVA